MKVLLLGASGVMGRRVASELARDPDVDRLVLSARRDEAVRELGTIFGGSSGEVSAISLDVTDTGALIRAARDVDVVVSCAGPFYLYEIDCVRAAIDAGTHYISLCDDHAVTDRIVALDPSARDAGVTIVSGCGFSPGITNFLAAIGASELDAVHEIEIAIGASSADPSGPATGLHFVTMMASDAAEISDHSIDRVPAATSPKLVYFPEPVGWVETFRCGHPEIVTLASLHPELRTLRFRIGLTERAAMDVTRASLATGLLATERNRRTFVRVSKPLRPFLESLPPRGAAWTGARVDVRGERGGRSHTVSLAVVDRISNLATIPLAKAAGEMMNLQGGGVKSPEQAFDPKSFLKGVADRGIRVARLEPQKV